MYIAGRWPTARPVLSVLRSACGRPVADRRSLSSSRSTRASWGRSGLSLPTTMGPPPGRPTSSSPYRPNRRSPRQKLRIRAPRSTGFMTPTPQSSTARKPVAPSRSSPKSPPRTPTPRRRCTNDRVKGATELAALVFAGVVVSSSAPNDGGHRQPDRGEQT
jgi:hypothetical protein